MQDMANKITAEMQVKINTYVDSTILPPLLVLKNTFASVGTGLKGDIRVLVNQGASMTATMKTEMDNIKSTLTNFGISIKNRAIDLSNGVKGVAKQMTDAVAEIRPSVEAASYEARQIVPRIKAFNPIGAGIATFYALAYLLFLKPRTATAQGGAVLPEMLEAYNQIGDSFTGLKDNFVAFGNTIKNQSTNVGNQVGTSSTNIKNSTNAFLLSFKGVFDNMSKRIEGGVAEVIKQIEVAKALPPPTQIQEPIAVRVGGVQEFEEQQEPTPAPAPVQEPVPEQEPARIGGLREFGKPKRRVRGGKLIR